MTNLWVYDGQLDAQEKVLTLDTVGPAMGGDGKTAKYRDIIEIKGDDARVLSSVMQGEDGNWHEVRGPTTIASSSYSTCGRRCYEVVFSDSIGC